jgi:hypothetical protein
VWVGIRGEIDDFLKDEGLICSATASAIVAIASKLTTIREEGLQLLPEVYICTNLDRLAEVIPGAQVVALGRGPHEDATVLKALKECGPLAAAGWAVFILRASDKFEYGLLGYTNLPLAMTPYEALVENPVPGVTTVVVRRVAEGCVELRGGEGHSRALYFSDERGEAPTPAAEIEKFCRAATLDVRGRQGEVQRFLYRTLSALLVEAHGALFVVLPGRRSKIPRLLKDCVSLPSAMSIAKGVSDYCDHNDNEALDKLIGMANLLKGMIGSDGIVVFRSNGSVVAYRAFLSQSGKSASAGGARRRAFDRLCSRLGKECTAVLMRSQDGHTVFSGNAA